MDLALQLLVVGLSQAAIYSMVATGFGLVLAVSHIFHFAHAAIFALAGFLAYAFIMQLGLPFWLGFVLTAILTVAAGLLIQLYIYAPLKRRNSGTFALVLASIGMQFAIENLIALGWGTGGRYLENPFGGVFYQIGTVIISLTDIVTLTVAIAGFGATMLFLKATRIGRAMMAYADNPTMAEVVGINPTLVSAVAISIASLLVVPAAIATDGPYATALRCRRGRRRRHRQHGRRLPGRFHARPARGDDQSAAAGLLVRHDRVPHHDGGGGVATKRTARQHRRRKSRQMTDFAKTLQAMHTADGG